MIAELAASSDLVVVPLRAVEDILASEKRIDLQCESMERMKFGGAASLPVSVIKYRFWDSIKRTLHHYMEFPYEALCGHPLWKGPQERKELKWYEI